MRHFHKRLQLSPTLQLHSVIPTAASCLSAFVLVFVCVARGIAVAFPLIFQKFAAPASCHTLLLPLRSFHLDYLARLVRAIILSVAIRQ